MTQQVTHTGRRGSTIQSWSKSNPRHTLKEIVEAHSGETKDSIYGRFCEATQHDEQAIEIMREYWFECNYRRLTSKPNDSAGLVREDLAQKIKARAAQMVFLDMLLPSGLLLREATSSDCAEAGGWLLDVSNRLDPGQRVGDALSEAELRAIWSERH